jgi:hypothetical protein
MLLGSEGTLCAFPDRLRQLHVIALTPGGIPGEGISPRTEVFRMLFAAVDDGQIQPIAITGGPSASRRVR